MLGGFLCRCFNPSALESCCGNLKLYNTGSVYFTCIGVLPVWIYVLQVHSWCPGRPEEGVRSPRAEFQMVVSRHVGGIEPQFSRRAAHNHWAISSAFDGLAFKRMAAVLWFCVCIKVKSGLLPTLIQKNLREKYSLTMLGQGWCGSMTKWLYRHVHSKPAKRGRMRDKGERRLCERNETLGSKTEFKWVDF